MKTEQKNRVMAADEITPEIQKRANRIAWRAGYSRATIIIAGKHDRLLSHTPYGYRKCTTGEYVPHAYMMKFGWKNTYYQRAETEVEIAL